MKHFDFTKPFDLLNELAQPDFDKDRFFRGDYVVDRFDKLKHKNRDAQSILAFLDFLGYQLGQHERKMDKRIRSSNPAKIKMEGENLVHNWEHCDWLPLTKDRITALWNEYMNVVEIGGKPAKIPRKDFDDLLNSLYDPSSNTCVSYDPTRDYFNSLGGIANRDDMPSDYYSRSPMLDLWDISYTDETLEYVVWVCDYIFSKMIASAYFPDFVGQHSVALIGRQGVGKTVLCEYMLPKNIDDSPVYQLITNQWTKGNKEFIEEAGTASILEFGEMADVGNTNFHNRLKALQTSDYITARETYRADPIRIPNRFLFMATTNDYTPLPDDQSGHRRWLTLMLKDKFPNSDKKDDLIYYRFVKERENIWKYYLSGFASVMKNGFEPSRLELPHRLRHIQENENLDLVDINEEERIINDFLEANRATLTLTTPEHLMQFIEGSGLSKGEADTMRKATVSSVRKALQRQQWDSLKRIFFVEGDAKKHKRMLWVSRDYVEDPEYDITEDAREQYKSNFSQFVPSANPQNSYNFDANRI